MKTYTNAYTQERMYIMSASELKQYRTKTIKKHRQYRVRMIKRIISWLLLWACRITAVSIITFAILVYFFCQIPPM